MARRESRIETADSSRPLPVIVRSMTEWFRREGAAVEGAIAVGRETAWPQTPPTRKRPHPSGNWRDGARNSVRGGNAVVCNAPSRTEQEESAILAGEQRSIVATAGPLSTDTRAAGTSTTTTAKELVGHAAVFGRWIEIGNWFREQIATGAFTSVLPMCDCRFLFNHDANHVFGRTTANTMELSEDRLGLRFVCHLMAFNSASYALAQLALTGGTSADAALSFRVGKETWKLADSDLGIWTNVRSWRSQTCTTYVLVRTRHILKPM